MAEFRSVQARRKWFLNNRPSGVGMCAQHTWHALGGDRGNPPRWFAADANAVVAKVRAAGELKTGRLNDIPKGAIVLWEYGSHGHMALSDGPGKIVTTDPPGKPGGTGVESVTYPARFGARNNGRPTGWTNYYAGTRFTTGDEDMPLSNSDLAEIRKIVNKSVDDAISEAFGPALYRAVNRTLGDWNAKGEPQASVPKGANPQTASTRLKAIAEALGVRPGFDSDEDGGEEEPEVIMAKDLFSAAGFKGEALDIMLGVSYSESVGGWADAVGDYTIVGTKWGPSVGLAQIRTLRDPAAWGGGEWRDIEKLRDPAYQAQAAWEISSHGTNFEPWSDFKNERYKLFAGEDFKVKFGHSTAGRWNLDGKLS